MPLRYERSACMAAALTILGLAALPTVSLSATVVVSGQSNVYLAGMPNGTPSTGGDQAPAQSPVLAPTICLQGGFSLSFSATGGVAADATRPLDPPDGHGSNLFAHPSEYGISNAVAPANALVGVFLGAGAPNLITGPNGLDFSSAASRNYTSLSPLLQQVFFIGDGTTSTSAAQTVVVPAGATRLYLGTMDGGAWNNNRGSFTVTVTELNSCPVPVQTGTWGRVKILYR